MLDYAQTFGHTEEPSIYCMYNEIIDIFPSNDQTVDTLRAVHGHGAHASTGSVL